jgi:hypothetical protein
MRLDFGLAEISETLGPFADQVEERRSTRSARLPSGPPQFSTLAYSPKFSLRTSNRSASYTMSSSSSLSAPSPSHAVDIQTLRQGDCLLVTQADATYGWRQVIVMRTDKDANRVIVRDLTADATERTCDLAELHKYAPFDMACIVRILDDCKVQDKEVRQDVMALFEHAVKGTISPKPVVIVQCETLSKALKAYLVHIVRVPFEDEFTWVNAIALTECMTNAFRSRWIKKQATRTMNVAMINYATGPRSKEVLAGELLPILRPLCNSIVTCYIGYYTHGQDPTHDDLSKEGIVIPCCR